MPAESTKGFPLADATFRGRQLPFRIVPLQRDARRKAVSMLKWVLPYLGKIPRVRRQIVSLIIAKNNPKRNRLANF